jgi:peroxiredoxin
VLAVEPGDRTPRALFTDDRGQRLALRKLRGGRVLLNFWQSWSAPCIRELRRLQGIQEQDGERAPTIVAVSAPDDRVPLADIRRKYGLTFALVHDSGGVLARQFAVRCWPTTLSIDTDGFVDGVQLGVAPVRPRGASQYSAR